MQEVKTLTELNALTAQGPVVIDFWAPWCGPCRALAPLFEKVSKANPDVTFVKCNIDDAQDLATEHQVTAIPCLKFFKDGNVVETAMGLLQESVLQSKVENLH